jgi:type IV pilus assembly protein PilM
VRAVQSIRRGNRVELFAAACTPLAPGEGEAELGAAVRRVLAGKFRGRRVAVALPADACEVRSIRLPQMPDAELRSAAEYEARERFPHLKSGWELRVLPAGSVGRAAEGQQEIIILAGAEAAIAARLELMTSLGLTVVALEPAMLAMFRPFADLPADDETARALIDIGARDTRILISRGTHPVFLKSCPVGGQMLDELTAGELKCSSAEAAPLRKQDGGDTSAEHHEALHRALRPALEQLGKEIGLCLRYYAVTFRGQRPDSLCVVGEEGQCAALRAGLTESTQLPVEAVDPFAGWTLGSAGAALEGQGRAKWTTAAGLALREPQLAAVGVDAGT